DMADVYFCDKCGQDITQYLHRGRAHVRKPIGPIRYTCVCGAKYLTGATEWDNLSKWSKRQWRSDAGIAAILLLVLLIPVALGFVAWHRHSMVLLGFLAATLIPSLLLLRLLALTLLGFVDIARSIWRTRFKSST